MKFDTLNQWLTLATNIAVVAGIVFVGIELQQTQTAMKAEASTMRAQMAMTSAELNSGMDLREILRKIESGIELNPEEENQLFIRVARQLRYYENLHYQWQLGTLDEEIWEANLTSIRRMHSNPGFNYLNPNWPNGSVARSFRRSFVELVESYRE